MGHIFRNLPPIPVPSEAHINHYDNRVFVEFKRNGVRAKRTVGVLANVEKRTMLANENFRRCFPHLWEHHYGESVPPSARIGMGLYAVTLALGWQSTLYPLVQRTFGLQHGNAIMDFAMYSIRERSNTAQLFPEDMKDQMLFSRKPLSDTWFSKLFAHEMTTDQIHKFRTEWLDHCVRQGTRKVWICIDGSNNDCAVRDSELAQRGKAKSHNDTTVVSYMWVVDAESGRPITWFVNKGSMPDCKAVDEVIRFLTASELAVEGFIFDRGFASKDVLDLVTQKKKQYIVMLKSNTKGFVDMTVRHADEIRWNVKCSVSDDGIFGITDTVKLFDASEKPSCVALFFVGMDNATRFIRLMSKVRQAAEKLRQSIAATSGNHEKIKVPAEVKNYLSLVKKKKTEEEEKAKTGKEEKAEEEEIVDVEYKYDAWQKASNSFGYHAIASSQNLSAQAIHGLYQLRDVSEKQYSILKSQLAADVTRVHSDEAIESRFAVCFVASIIRTELQLQCKRIGLDVNVMLRKLDDVHMTRMPGSEYEAVRTHSADVSSLLAKFGIKFAHLQKLAEEVNQKDPNADNDLARKIPDVAPTKRGRKPGSKNKKTLEREAKEAALEAERAARAAEAAARAEEQTETAPTQDADVQGEEKPKRGPGRPPGSKNKKTLALEAAIAAGLVEQPPKRKPGRPKGSKNKKTLEREAREARIAEGRRGPGRPKGSKNKPKEPASES